MSKQNLMGLTQAFFQSYLAAERGLSPHSIKAYRDSIKLYLNHLSKLRGKKISSIGFDDLTVESVLSFLGSIEKDRGNSIRTRNHRLAVLKTYFNYLLTNDVERANQYSKITHLTMKRMPYIPITYLTQIEVKAFFHSIDQETFYGKRNYAILMTLYNTGARVQEVCDLKVSDIRLEEPYMITLTGKGRKTRQVPLWKETVTFIKKFLSDPSYEITSEHLFYGTRSSSFSRFGIRGLIKRLELKAQKKCPSLKRKKIGPHTFRHTTAMHLLQSGVDIAVIKTWLGHVDLNTTHNYVEIDMKMKEDALRKTKPKDIGNRRESYLKREKDIVDWLKEL
jgi:integrase/recombinase XerD